MRISRTFLGGATAILAALSLSACGTGAETETSDEDTSVANIDPGEGDGTINDTTLIDATIGAEEAMGMESRMPADSAETPAASNGEAEAEAPAEPGPEPEAETPAPEPEASEPEETAAEE